METAETGKPAGKIDRRFIIRILIPAVIYGLLTRVAFQDDSFSRVSLGFLALVPLASGALTVFAAQHNRQKSWTEALSLPVIPAFVFLVAVLVFNLEIAICIVMILPFFLALASIGGLVMYFTLLMVEGSGVNKQAAYAPLVLLLVAPYIVSAAESQSRAPVSLRTVETQIVINADAATVWHNITSVPTISEGEHRLSIFQFIGVPRPVQASLARVEVGATRHSSWESGVAVVEVITELEPERLMNFTMSLDSRAGIPEPFDEIGGQYFDVIEGGYRIEPIGENQVVLHLWSTHRLSTRINGYGGLWTDLILWDLQHYILGVVKARSE